MTRRKFAAALAALLTFPARIFAKSKPIASSTPCACCDEPIVGKPYIWYERAKFGPVIYGKLITYDQIEWGKTTTLCAGCNEHHDVLNARRYYGRPTQRDIAHEIMMIERTPTPEGFYRPLPTSLTLWHDPQLSEAVHDVFMVDPVESVGPNNFHMSVRAVPHFKHKMWVLTA